MATLPDITAGTKVTAAGWWNPLTDQVNTNTNDISSIKTTNTNQDLSITALQNRATVLETAAPFAAYGQSANTTGNGRTSADAAAYTPLKFNTVLTADAAGRVSLNANQTLFTLNKPGRWEIIGSVGVSNTATPTGQLTFALCDSDTVTNSPAKFWAQGPSMNVQPNNGGYSQVSTLIKTAASATVAFMTYSYGAGGYNTVASGTNIQITWIGP